MPMPAKKLTPEQVSICRKLYAEKRSLRQIARQFGVSYWTIQQAIPPEERRPRGAGTREATRLHNADSAAETTLRHLYFSGSALATSRQARGLTQAQLAYRIDATPDLIRRWEHDESTPSGVLMARLLVALNVDARRLLTYGSADVERPPNAA